MTNAFSYRVFPLNSFDLPAWTEWPERAVAADSPEGQAIVNSGRRFGIETTGLVVLDLDLDHGNGHDGPAAFSRLGLVESPVQTTSRRGGKHLYWALPEGEDPAEYRSSASKLAPGVDVKSWHSFARETALPAEPPAAPPALLALVRKVPREQTTLGRVEGVTASVQPPYVRQAVANLAEALSGAKGGEHNAVQTHAALRLVELSNNPASGLTYAEAQATFEGACAKFDDASAKRWEYAVERQAEAMAYVPCLEPVTDSALDRLVEVETQNAYVREKAKLAAATRLADESFKGSTVFTWEQLFSDPLEWLVADLLPTGASAFLVGKPNLGKTFAYIDMAMSVVTGKAWLGHKTTPGRVMFVLGEGRAGFGVRLLAWLAAHDVDAAEVRDRVTFVDSANLTSDACLRRLTEAAEANQPDLIVFDTYAAISGVESENEAAQNALVLQRARTIRPEAATLFVAHPTKSTEDSESPVLRGSGALAGDVDLVLTLWADKDYQNKDGQSERWLALSTEGSHGGKNRNAATRTWRGLYLNEVADSMVLKSTAGAYISTADANLLANLEDGMTVKAFARKTGITEDKAKRWLKASALVKVVKPAAGPKPAEYALIA